MGKRDKHETSPCLVSKQIAVFCKPPSLGQRQKRQENMRDAVQWDDIIPARKLSLFYKICN